MIPVACARTLAGRDLAAAQRETRATTLHHLSLWQSLGLPGSILPELRAFNPPAWEAGHIAWFQEYWLNRNPERLAGVAARPDAARGPAWLENADALYNSSQVAHGTRWHLPLPDDDILRAYLVETLSASLALLERQAEGDAALYFHRLALFHEDMHNEAAIYMANHAAALLGLTLEGFAPAGVTSDMAGGDCEPPASPQTLVLSGGSVVLGWPAAGFAFDNECPPQMVTVADSRIDATLTTVQDFLAFMAADGYHTARWWTAAGWAWRQAEQRELPAFHRWRAGTLERCWFGQWRALRASDPVLHASAHEADAYCAWAGRRLPSEGEWMLAVRTQNRFRWGDAWEWTRDAFAPFPGFVAHPYEDYSQPWFHTHRLLKGASPATHARLRDPRYRNFYPAGRTDIFCSFRTVQG